MTSDRLAAWSRELVSLHGRRVGSWVGVEMALWGPDGSDPQFGNPGLPCLHLLGLQANLDDGGAATIGTAQNDAYFGLRPSPTAKFSDDIRRPETNRPWDGIYRWRALPELPVGDIEQVSTFAEEGVLAEIHLRIDGQPLLLIAGDLDGLTMDEMLFYRLDDSVLAFTDADAFERTPWSHPRSLTPMASAGSA